jgi:hypothetical protein
MRTSVLTPAVIASIAATVIGPAAVPASAAPTDTYGTATAVVSHFYGDHIDYVFDGQITIGGQTYRGRAQGTADIANRDDSHILVGDPAEVTQVPPFTVSGTSSTGTLVLTCSGEFAESPLRGLGAGLGRSSLACHKPFVPDVRPTSVTLDSVYRVTARSAEHGTYTAYDGAFTGSALDAPLDPPAHGPLPVVSESVTVDPNRPIVPGGLVSFCLTPKSVGAGQTCIQI